MSKAKGDLSAKESASVEAQDSAVDGTQPDSSSPASDSETVAHNRGEADANANGSSAGASGKAAAAAATAERGGGGEEEGLLSGIAGSVSGWFSSSKE